MSRSPTALPLTARLARRELQRRPWRTLLVALLIAIPVGIMTFSVVITRTDIAAMEDAWQMANGNADVVLMSGRNGGETDAAERDEAERDPSAADVAPPADATTVVARMADFRSLRTTDGVRSRSLLSDLSLEDAMTSPIVRIEDGRAPRSPGEVLLSPDVADDLDAQVGDVLHLERPSSVDVTVVGIGRLRGDLVRSVTFVAPGTSLLGVDAQMTRTYIDLAGGVDDPWLDALLPFTADGRPGGQVAEVAPDVRAAHPELASLVSPMELDEPVAMRWVWVVGSLVATVTSIVVASAFASGARRQLATLGQLSANGAPPELLRRTLLLQGTWVGVVGSIAGLAFGAVGLALFRRRVDGLFGRDLGSYVVRPLDLVPPVIIGVVAATIAALVPARTTSRVPVLAALAGRRPLTAVPRWVTGAGLVTAAGGLGLFGLAILGGRSATENDGLWSFVAILGGMGVLLGACAIAPAYVGVLDRAGARLSGSWRFAARSLARQRTRTGAVISAVCATSALAILSSALVVGALDADEARQATERLAEVHVETLRHKPTDDPSRTELTGVEPPAALLDALQRAVPTMERIQLTRVEVPDANARAIALADDALLDVYGLRESDRATLEEVGALAFSHDGVDPPIATHGQSPFQFAIVDGDRYSLGMLPLVIMTPAAAAAQGYATGPGPVVLRNSSTFTRDQLAELEDVADEFLADSQAGDVVLPGADGTFTGFTVYETSKTPSPFVLEAILSGVALALALFVVGVSLALAAAETRDERDVLAVVGAAPAVMRRTSAQKAAILTVMSALLAIPVGFLPAVVFTAADGRDAPWLVFPWRTVLLLLIAVPVVTAAVTSLASTLALRVRPVRVSTMTFE